MFGIIGSVVGFIKDVVVAVVNTTIAFISDIFKNLPAVCMMILATVGVISMIPAMEVEAAVAGVTIVNKYMVIPVLSAFGIYFLGLLSGVWYETFNIE